MCSHRGAAWLLAVVVAGAVVAGAPGGRALSEGLLGALDRCPSGDFRGAGVDAHCSFDFDLGDLVLHVTSTGLPDHTSRLVSEGLAQSQPWSFSLRLPRGGVPPEAPRPEGGRALPQDSPVGVALNGVPFFAAPAPLDELEAGEALDECLGTTLDTATSGAYVYRAAPPCLDGQTTVAYDLQSMLEGFSRRQPKILGYMLDGFPLYGPFDAAGNLHTDLDSCNGKFVDGAYAYYATPNFPYIAGCFGPGVQVQQQVELPPLASSASAPDTECPAGMQPSLLGGCELCPGGRHGPRCERECGPGFYCPPGTLAPLPCPAGRYGASPGLVSADCSGPCRAGYYCPEQSTSATAQPCGGPHVFCPEGSTLPTPVVAGYYTVPELASRSRAGLVAARHREGQEICPVGHFCVAGIKAACAPGTYGSEPGLTSATCTSPCPQGHFCPEASVLPTTCPPGSFGNASGLTSAECAGSCQPGYYCPEASTSATQVPCRPGRFCAMPGLESDLGNGDDNLCSQGYYCPPASTSPQEMPCGASDVYCPPGSALPTKVSLGYYTTGPASKPGEFQSLADAATRDSQEACEEATYCVDGVKTACPPGTFGATRALSSSSCSGLCAPGYYCPLMSNSSQQRACGSVDVFCPLGSVVPTQVSPGNFTTGGAPHTRHAEQLCEPGHYCAGGLRRACRAGVYGSTYGLRSSDCSGACAPGYYCPEESVSATQFTCEAGRWSAAGAGTPLCSGLCLAGYYCPAGSDVPNKRECGSETLYCPVGSPKPFNVSRGYYSTGQNPRRRTGQVACNEQHTPPAGADRRISVCPSTTAPLQGPHAWYDEVIEWGETSRTVDDHGLYIEDV